MVRNKSVSDFFKFIFTIIYWKIPNMWSDNKTKLNSVIQVFPTKIAAVQTAPTAAGSINPSIRKNRRKMRIFYLPKVTYAPAPAEATAAGQPKARRPRKRPSPNDVKVKRLHEEYKKRYVQPPIDQIPYNKRMARKFASTVDQTPEEKGRRDRQADASRVSRDRMKFVDRCVAAEHAQLEAELLSCMRELLIAENCVDEYCQENGMEAIDWKILWDSIDGDTA